MEKLDLKKFRVDSNIELKNVATSYSLETRGEEIDEILEDTREKLGKWQDILYAHGKYSVLVCLQGMDTAGKDSLIREVFKDFNSRGVVVHSFKVPTPLELKHDFLWRHYIALPAAGKFGVFNRTHYENVLVTKVHPEYILNENLPKVKNLNDVNEEFWEDRYESIRNFEKHLTENRTLIFKFFLNISKEEQRQRLLRRLDKQEKNWKFSPGDLKERELWNKYQEAYEQAINATSRPHAPWYVIPSDDKDTARYLVAKILYDVLIEYKDIQEPELSQEIKNNLEEYREILKKETL